MVIFGAVVLLIGLLLIPLPGPGLVIVPFGVLILAAGIVLQMLRRLRA